MGIKMTQNNVHNLLDDMAYQCECGSATFNYLKSHKLECKRCGLQTEIGEISALRTDLISRKALLNELTKFNDDIQKADTFYLITNAPEAKADSERDIPELKANVNQLRDAVSEVIRISDIEHEALDKCKEAMKLVDSN